MFRNTDRQTCSSQCSAATTRGRLTIMHIVVTYVLNLWTGSIGFFACLWFVSKIYSVVKVD